MTMRTRVAESLPSRGKSDIHGDVFSRDGGNRPVAFGAFACVDHGSCLFGEISLENETNPASGSK
jgi:hypothetical protein